jgi:hypothetical protein
MPDLRKVDEKIMQTANSFDDTVRKLVIRLDWFEKGSPFLCHNSKHILDQQINASCLFGFCRLLFFLARSHFDKRTKIAKERNIRAAKHFPLEIS